ncbi:MAG: M23 family metallopeptidase [Oscillospiraceae bacterium]|nr:M23 family metallopeptidase [Oscillospiraceae bacterium]
MNDEYNESESFLGGKGFYISHMLCVSIIVVSAWMLVNNSEEDETEALADTTLTPYVHQEVIEWKDPVPVPTQVIVPEVPEVAQVMEPEPVEEPVQEVYVPVEDESVQTVNLETLSYVWPVIGEVELPYSMDRLVYNVTMGDWRTHDGIDIAAQAGEYVRSAAAGTVTDVYDDVLYGTTVVIDHGAGLVSYYANLQAEPVVRVGDRVLAGDTIGAVGETALCETGEPPHLHFAMSLNDNSVDPGAYMPVL